MSRRKVLVAGLGNILAGDDGFGSEVLRRLGGTQLPDWVRAADFGIRGSRLADELLDHDYEMVVLVDATLQGGLPGTIYLSRLNLRCLSREVPFSDSHSMDPAGVLKYVQSIGSLPGRIWIVGCEPSRLEPGIGLSRPVARAVAEAVRVILRLLARVESNLPLASSGSIRENDQRKAAS